MKNAFNDENSSLKGSIAISIVVLFLLLGGLCTYIEEHPGKIILKNDGSKIEISIVYK